MRRLLLIACIGVAACGGASDSVKTPPHSEPSGEAYRASVEAFRSALETKLTSDTGWLTIAGLSFLTKPETSFGSAPGNDIVLPGATPARVGTFVLAKDGRISVRLTPGLQVQLLDGRTFAGGEIKTDG